MVVAMRCSTLQWQGMQHGPRSHKPLLKGCQLVIAYQFLKVIKVISLSMSELSGCQGASTNPGFSTVSRCLPESPAVSLNSLNLRPEVPLGHGFTAQGFLHPDEAMITIWHWIHWHILAPIRRNSVSTFVNWHGLSMMTAWFDPC